MTHKTLNLVKILESRPVSPNCSNFIDYDMTDECTVPFCPKHGYLKKIGCDENEKCNMSSMTNIECIKNIQKRKMRELHFLNHDTKIDNKCNNRIVSMRNVHADIIKRSLSTGCIKDLRNKEFTITMNDNYFEPCINNLYTIVESLHIMIHSLCKLHIFILHNFFLFQYM